LRGAAFGCDFIDEKNPAKPHYFSKKNENPCKDNFLYQIIKTDKISLLKNQHFMYKVVRE